MFSLTGSSQLQLFKHVYITWSLGKLIRIIGFGGEGREEKNRVKSNLIGKQENLSVFNWEGGEKMIKNKDSWKSEKESDYYLFS